MTAFQRVTRWMLPSILAVVWMTSTASAADPKWTLTFGVGLTASGELFTARSEDNEPGWTTPAGNPIPGVQLTTQLDETIGGWVRLRRVVAPKVSVAVGVGATDMDVTASVKRETNTVDAGIPYDQMFALMTDLVAMYDFVPVGNTLYVLGGAGYNSLGFETRIGGDSLDQGVFALVLGAGFRLRAMEGLQIEIDVRDSISWPDLGAEERRLAPDQFESNTLHLFQITLGWAFSF